MVQKILGLVIIKGIIMATLIIGVAESSLINGIIVAAVSAFINGIMLFFVARYGTIKKVEDKVDEVKEHIEKDNNG